MGVGPGVCKGAVKGNSGSFLGRLILSGFHRGANGFYGDHRAKRSTDSSIIIPRSGVNGKNPVVRESVSRRGACLAHLEYTIVVEVKLVR